MAALSTLLPWSLLSRTLTLSPTARSPRAILSRLVSLYVRNRRSVSRIVFVSFLLALVVRVRHAIAEQKAASLRQQAAREAASASVAMVVASVDASAAAAGDVAAPLKPKKVELDRQFFRSLLRLLRIVVPSWRSKEARLLLSHSFFLIFRTLLSLRVAAMDGAIVKSLVKGNGREFLTRIVWWMVIAVPATFTNSMVGYPSTSVCFADRIKTTPC